MRASWQWSAPGVIAQVSAEEGARCFYGSAVLYIDGEKFGPWHGNRYGIPEEFPNERKALVDMAVFIFHEIEHYEVEGKEEILEKIANGQSSVDTTFENSLENVEETLLAELKAWGQLTSETTKPMEAKADKAKLFDIPKIGDQLPLF